MEVVPTITIPKVPYKDHGCVTWEDMKRHAARDKEEMERIMSLLSYVGAGKGRGYTWSSITRATRQPVYNHHGTRRLSDR